MIASRFGVACVATLMMLGGFPDHAYADATLGGTRVVFLEKRHEASITITNTGSSPYVIQAWIDNGEPAPARIEAGRMADGHTNVRKKAPIKPALFVSPPLFRLDSGKENILRIIRGSGELPADRESVFWLNAKEIPVDTHEDGALQIAIRSRIKVFYRPEGLEGTSALAPSTLQWRIERSPALSNPRLHIHNPSAYHVTFSSVLVSDGIHQREIDLNMIAPGGDLQHELTDMDGINAINATYQTLTDFGGETRASTIRLE